MSAKEARVALAEAGDAGRGWHDVHLPADD